jgi:ACS family hexuronate transporter-like MFS transporter
LGLAWIPLWKWAYARVPAAPVPKQPLSADRAMLRDPRLWAFVAANALSMMGYYLWGTWTTLLMTDVYHLTLQQAVWYVWIPPVFAAAGGFGGGWLSLWLVERGVLPPAARFRVCLAASVLALATAAIPWAPSPGWASAGISLSILAVAAFSVNMYTLPLDTFGAAPAAFAVAILVSSYGAISAIIAPIIGTVIDHRGYTPVILAIAFTPLLASAVLWFSRSTR